MSSALYQVVSDRYSVWHWDFSVRIVRMFKSTITDNALNLKGTSLKSMNWTNLPCTVQIKDSLPTPSFTSIPRMNSECSCCSTQIQTMIESPGHQPSQQPSKILGQSHKGQNGSWKGTLLLYFDMACVTPHKWTFQPSQHSNLYMHFSTQADLRLDFLKWLADNKKAFSEVSEFRAQQVTLHRIQ